MDLQLIGSLGTLQMADQADTSYRCAGPLQDSTDSNMGSLSTKSLA